jgi:hypothetical protein
MRNSNPLWTSLRTSCFIAAITLTAVHVSAQDVEIKPQLRAGDEFRLEVTRTREDTSRPQQNGKSRTVVDVRVLSATPAGFVLDWAPGETVLDNPQVAMDPVVMAASRIVSQSVFRLNLSAEGEFAGVANEAEVSPKLQAMLNTIIQSLAERLPADQRTAFHNLIGQMLSPAALISSATREAEIYFSLNGVALAVGEAAEAGLEQPSPVGGGIIPATFRVDMESATTESASLRTTTAYDPAALLRMTQSLVQQAGRPIPPDELARIPPMQMSDDGKFVFDRAVGLMREVVVNRRVSAGDVRRHDGWQIRLLHGPKRGL